MHDTYVCCTTQGMTYTYIAMHVYTVKYISVVALTM